MLTLNQREIKFKPRIKLNHGLYNKSQGRKSVPPKILLMN